MSTEPSRLERAWAAYAAAKGRSIAELHREALEAKYPDPVEYEKNVRELFTAYDVAWPDEKPVAVPEPTAPVTTTAPAARRQPIGMAPEVRRAMPDLAHRLYLLAEARADRLGRFTCTRPHAMRTLLASDGGIGKAIRLHLAAGVWKRDRPGGWRQRGRQRPRQTVYSLVDDFDREHAIRTYREHRSANRARLAALREAQSRSRNLSTVPVPQPTVPVTVPVQTGTVGAVYSVGVGRLERLPSHTEKT